MTPSDSANRKTQATPRPVLLERLYGIGRTGRCVTARRWQQWTQEELVPAHQRNQDGSHVAFGFTASSRWKVSPSSARKVVKDNSYALGAARRITSQLASSGNRSSRITSRSRRLRRLRATAVRPCRGTMIPALGNARGEAHARTVKCRLRTNFPSTSIRRISASRLMRCAREKRQRCLRGGVLRRKPHGEPLPPLLATPTEHFPTPARRHPRAKSVLPDPALVARAIRRLSHMLCM